MLRRSLLTFCSLLILQVLVACGNAAGSAATPSSRAVTAPQPAANGPPAALATQPPAPAAEAAIPESVTAEGYHMLGRPDAPVTLTMYSDFL